jgi:alcohol dehydrogenase (NADP+)
MGGLGHLAVMYARAMGCEVVVISSSDSKRDDAFALGASDFVNLRGEGKPSIKSGNGINVLLLCGGGQPDFDAYVCMT